VINATAVALYGDDLAQDMLRPGQSVFPMSYNTARIMVRKAGRLLEIHLRPHDLRRHAATFASRSGTPIEIVSKVISTTQRYLGKVTDVEAMRRIENLYG
jgi:integrase/recombinase XerD